MFSWKVFWRAKLHPLLADLCHQVLWDKLEVAHCLSSCTKCLKCPVCGAVEVISHAPLVGFMK